MIRGLANTLLPRARKLIKDKYEAVKNGTDIKFKSFFKEEQENEEPSIKIIEIYENYTAAFGMIVNQSGFQVAFAIYNEEKTNSEGNRNLITQLLYEILRSPDIRLIQENSYQLCCENILNGSHRADDYEDLFKEASIALKHAIRTFEIVKK